MQIANEDNPNNLSNEVIGYAVDLFFEDSAIQKLRKKKKISQREEIFCEARILTSLSKLRMDEPLLSGRELEAEVKEIVCLVIGLLREKRKHLRPVEDTSPKPRPVPRPSRRGLLDNHICVSKRASKIDSWRST
ncbi:MAG: hypothetical protein Q8P54_02685 [bacterium]|nr:hypothetical protein [bacterium]